ncbi:MAG: hypothetical protein GXO62_03885 [Epsilonproteobacteria bacterium]|nr:hypothetical protein [Campylobacterota bacterium]
MRNYFICLFHIVIISFFFGCGYKAPPSWENKKSEVNASDFEMVDFNGSIKVKIGVK